MADPTIDNTLDRRAAFGANFLGTTNLAQRRRYQEDIVAAKNAEVDVQEQKFERANSRAELADPLKARQIGLAERRAISQEEQFGARMTAEERRFQMRMQKDREVLSLRERQAEIAERKELRSATDARRVLENTEAVEEADFKLRSEGVLPGSPEYAQAMVQQVIRNPYIDPGYRKTILEQANVKVDPEKIMREWAAKGRNPVITARISPDGEESYTIREAADPKAPKPVDPAAQRRSQWSEYNMLVAAFNKEPQGSPMRGFLEKQINSMRGQMMEAGEPTQPDAINQPQKPTASIPAIGASVGASVPSGTAISGSPVTRFVPDGKGGWKQAQ